MSPVPTHVMRYITQIIFGKYCGRSSGAAFGTKGIKVARLPGSNSGREFIFSKCDHYVASIKFHLRTMVSDSSRSGKRAMCVRRERNPVAKAAEPGG
jgi:hypothetical protein